MPNPIRLININLGHLAARTRTPGKTAPTPSRPSSIAVDLSPAALAAQQELDVIKTQIGDLVDNRGQSGSGVRVEDASTALSRFRVGRADLQPGQFVDLDVEITASAQQAGLYLSFGGNLDFHAGTSSMLLNIGGALGSQEFSFTSGTSVADVAAAINTFFDVTGVQATASGTGVVLRTPSYGTKEFVSVQTGGDAAPHANGGGVYDFLDDDANTIDASHYTSFANAANPINDHGQDVAATINNHALTGEGALLTYTGPFLTAQLDLEFGPLGKGEFANAQHLGSFRAARVLWDGSLQTLSDTPPGIDVSG